MHLKYHCGVTLLGLNELLSIKDLGQGLVHTMYHVFTVIIIII